MTHRHANDHADHAGGHPRSSGPVRPGEPATPGRRVLNFLAFPGRAITVMQKDLGPLQSLRSERFSYVAEETVGRCLDIGCGPENRFIRSWHPHGLGIDVFGYEGLTEEQVVADMTALPFDDGSFDTVTLIAALNHIPEPLRVPELREMRRVLAPGGRLVLTMGNALAEVTVHKLVHTYAHAFGTHEDMDGERGMEHDENFSVAPREIRSLLQAAGFDSVRRRRFWSQWGLNSLYIARK